MIFSISAIQASDINITDSNGLSLGNYENQLIGLNSTDSNDIASNEDDYFKETAKNRTELTSKSDSIYYKGSYEVTLKDSNNTNLADKNVTFTINNLNYHATTDSNGIAIVNLNLNPGKYTANVYFAGDDSYDASNYTATIVVLSTIKSADVVKYYKGSAQYIATFFDSNGKVLANRNVDINVNGKSYTKKTNNNGVASLEINFKPGTYKVVSTDPITGYKLTKTFTILSTISGNNINKVAGDGKKFTAKFFKSNGNVLAHKKVKIKLKGKVYKVKTNAKGQATLSLKKLKKGTYKVICYNIDGLSNSYKIRVLKIATTKLTTQSYTFLPNDNKEVKVSLYNSLGGTSNSGKTIKIKIKGKTYSSKTDSNGNLYFKLLDLKKGVYSVDYSFKGNKFIKSSKSTNDITILDTEKTKLTVKGTILFGHGAKTPLKVALTAGGVPLAKKTVQFTIGNDVYKRTTDNNGIASLPINLNIGTYTVNFKFNKESKLNMSNGDAEIKVVKRNATQLTWKSGSSFKDSSQTFKVQLTDNNGKPIAGETVTLNIDSKSYSVVTNSNGYATFKTYVALGKYKVSFKFDGNNLNLQSSSSKSIDVKLTTFKSGANEKHATSYLKSYLKSSSHCQVGASKIKKLVKKLTHGLNSKVDKAKAIFNYVRDHLSYSYYYNTHYGATGTLKAKKGNCVDHAHLLVAMFRTAGLPARYVHGTCHFASGNVYGHVWAQVLVDKQWVGADAISYSNSLGKIYNWNVKSYHLHGKYASLPF